jgi:hypothetical protein
MNLLWVTAEDVADPEVKVAGQVEERKDPNKFRKRKRVKYHALIVVSGAYKKDSSSLGVDWLGSFYLYSRS